jgi:hypothetical protein
MMTKAQLIEMDGHGILYSTTMKDSRGQPRIAKLNSKVQTWKRSPHKFIQSLKLGLRTYIHVTDENADEWSITKDAI